jgi:hypothetical protein
MAKIKRSHRAVLAMAKAGKIFNEIKKIDEKPKPMNVDDVFIVLRDMQDVDLSNIERFVM